MTTVNRRHRLAALTAALAVGIAGTVAPVLAQEPPAPPDPAATSTTTTSAPPITILPGETTTTTIVEPPPPEDPGGHEELPPEEVPVVPETVPPRPPDPGAYAAEAGQVIRRQLRVAEAAAVQLGTASDTHKAPPGPLGSEPELGRASWRERVGQCVKITVVAG